jgi:hypothetical protein
VKIREMCLVSPALEPSNVDVGLASTATFGSSRTAANGRRKKSGVCQKRKVNKEDAMKVLALVYPGMTLLDLLKLYCE